MRSTLALALPALAIVIATPAFADPFAGVHVAVNRHEYRGRGCPVEVIFTASINFTMPHPRGFVFNYHWERSDGAKGPVHVVRPSSGERTLVVREKWRLGGHGTTHDISQTIHLNSGNEHLTEGSPTVHIECL